MKESYRKGVANHPDPKSCVWHREVTGEALTGAQAGRTLSCEIYLPFGVPTLFCEAEGYISEHVMRVLREPCAVRDPRHAWKLHMREPGGPIDVHSHKLNGPVGEGHKPNDQHARLWGVGRMGSTDEMLEQRGTEHHRETSAESMEGSRSAKRKS